MLLRDNATRVTILGDTRIDINEDELPPGQTILDTVTILGETVITVPEGVAVTINAICIAGNADIGRGVETQRRPGGAELVITGAALLGSITVKLKKVKKR
jgi:predicted membrane protein